MSDAPVAVEDIFIEALGISPFSRLELHELKSIETGEAVEFLIKFVNSETVEVMASFNADYFELETCQQTLELYALAALQEGAN